MLQSKGLTDERNSFLALPSGYRWQDLEQMVPLLIKYHLHAGLWGCLSTPGCWTLRK